MLTARYHRVAQRDAVLYVNGTTRTRQTGSLAGGSGRAYTADGAQRGSIRGPQVVVPGGGFAITS
ncbi:hypothetical protein [Metallococcus carri]|uniref:hypothetical protein n=1 Tax=Metallococcus carri TaxID=1656884 RepID=UPI001409CC10|nr:hypothetical protein [Metallococcus carri]